MAGVENVVKGLMTCIRPSRWRLTRIASKRTYSFYAESNNFIATGQKAPYFLQGVAAAGDKTAILGHNGKYRYKELHDLSVKLSHQLQSLQVLQGERIAFITPNDASYVVSKWAAWLCGGIAVPLCKTHPPNELSYILENSKPKIVISTPEFSEMMLELSNNVGAWHIVISLDSLNDSTNPPVLQHRMAPKDNAMLIYTSGTTGRPKGALWTHSSLRIQVDMMLKSWQWKRDDTILHVLPLHHWHGIVNALMCPLAIGATIVMKNNFAPNEVGVKWYPIVANLTNAFQVWDLLLGEVKGSPNISVFMAVPTIYVKLLQYFESSQTNQADEIAKRCRAIRLMVAGSAALPAPIYKKWKDLTTHDLLERYGMTEIGMSLTNSYHGERLPGFVGLPFPGQEVRIVSDSDGSTIVHATSENVAVNDEGKSQQGELMARGPIFKEYWENPKATEEAFQDGWFKTGDTAAFENGSFKIVGRSSVDIIKSGGYKIGALDIERLLLGHPNVAEVAVVGVPDETWGQVVGALIVLKDKKDILDLAGLHAWCSPRMASYRIPRVMGIVGEIPKNAMGKVNKKELCKLFK